MLGKQPADKQYELILNFLRAFHSEIADKDQLVKRTYFGAIFELFDDVVRKARKEFNSGKFAALQTVVKLLADISEANYSGPAKRQRLVEEMRNRLHSDTSIDPEDI